MRYRCNSYHLWEFIDRMNSKIHAYLRLFMSPNWTKFNRFRWIFGYEWLFNERRWFAPSQFSEIRISLKAQQLLWLSHFKSPTAKKKHTFLIRNDSFPTGNSSGIFVQYERNHVWILRIKSFLPAFYFMISQAGIFASGKSNRVLHFHMIILMTRQ